MNNNNVGGAAGTCEGPAAQQDNLLILDNLLMNNANWDRLAVKKIVADEWANWLNGLTNWSSFITLTFRENRESDVANTLFKKLIRALNEDKFGRHYFRKVGHSYFSYVVASEFTKLDVIHFHCLVDQPINYSLVHSYWGAVAGFAWVEKIRSVNCVSAYVSKYVVKSCQSLDVYKSNCKEIPVELRY